MKKKNYLWSMLAIIMAAMVCMGLSSCDKSEPSPELTIGKSSISLDANGNGDRDIPVTASHTDWSATVIDGSPWLRVNKNGSLATVSVDANTTTQTRSGRIKITATEDTKLSYDVSVSQSGADGTISISIGSVEFEAEGGSQTIQVTSNSGWNVSGNAGWLTVNPSSATVPTSGSESKSVSLTASENTSKDSRSCTLTFSTTDGKSSTTISITQKKPVPFILVNGLESTSLQFSSNSGVNYKQTVKVSSNVSWSMSGVPDWLSVSPVNGSGDISIDIYPKTENDAEDKERSAKLILSSGDAVATIMVSQDTDLDPNASVKPTNVVRLYNGIAFDYEFGRSVSYYYRGYLEKDAVASMTDAEIITVLEDNFNRYTQSDDEIAVFAGLDEGKAYMIYTVGYNKNGKRGQLVKTEFVTKTKQNNEPVAWISNPTTDGSYWYWSIQKSATCYSYYMITTENYDFAVAPDVYQAWIIDYYIRQNKISEYVNGGDWYSAKSGSLIAVMTWGLDKNGNFANVIDWNAATDGNSSSMRAQRRSKAVKTDKNYPILNDSKLKVFRRR